MSKNKTGHLNWLFLTPALLINFSVILIPALITILIAFTKWNGLGTPVFVGFKNYIDIFNQEAYITALTNNFKWTAIFLTVPVIMGLIGAALLLSVKKGRTLYQVIFFIPMIVIPVISCGIWKTMIFHPLSGVFGWLSRHGLTYFSTNPLTNPSTSLLTIAFVDNWHWWGFLAVVFFAAMRQIDPSLLEVADLEGANFWQRFRYVIFPSIMPTFTFMMIMSLIWSFLTFTFVYALTQGGPGNSSEVLATYTYTRAFQVYRVGQASAVATTISLLSGIGIAVYVLFQVRGGEMRV